MALVSVTPPKEDKPHRARGVACGVGDGGGPCSFPRKVEGAVAAVDSPGPEQPSAAPRHPPARTPA